ncbi:MAG: glycosyltransferase family 4 protein [Pseudomonadales bacterium]|nr:glycosyltransferase family 4 protein [Pseudomonadales bacterium]
MLLRHGLSFPFLQLLRKASKMLVFDFDDAVFTKSSGKPSSVRAKRFDKTVALCDQIWAGNRYLAHRAKHVNQNVFVLPTAVDMSRYESVVANKPTEFVDLVWIGSRSTSKYLKEILPILELAAQKDSCLRLKIIADFSLESQYLTIIPVNWREESEVQELKQAHIGIAPMPDTPWTRGKCALKVLQYMAASLPVISSNCGANAEVIVHRKTGLLVNTENEWLEAILELSKNSRLRHEMGKNALQSCSQSYSLDKCSEKILELLEKKNSVPSS